MTRRRTLLLAVGLLLVVAGLGVGAFTDQTYAHYSHPVAESAIPPDATVISHSAFGHDYPWIERTVGPLQEGGGGGDAIATIPESLDPPDLLDLEWGTAPSWEPFYVQTADGYYEVGWIPIPGFEPFVLFVKYTLLFVGVNLLGVAGWPVLRERLSAARAGALVAAGVAAWALVEYYVPDYALHLAPLAVALAIVWVGYRRLGTATDAPPVEGG